MRDLNLALSYETLSGTVVGILLGLGVVLFAFMAAPRLFRTPIAQRIFYLSVGLRFVLICLSATAIFNGPSSDLAWFEIDAARIAQGALPLNITIASADNFEAIHAAFAFVFGSSFFLADSIGLFGFMLSVIFLSRFIRLLKLESFENWVLLPYCFLPGSLLYLNYNTREVFQVLFMILTLSSIVQYRASGSLTSLGKALLFGYLFAFTHNRYIVVVPAFIAVGIFLPNLVQKAAKTWSHILVFPFAVGLLLLINMVSNSQGFLTTVQDAGLVNYVSDLAQRGGDLQARTQFPFLLTSADTGTFLLLLPIMMLQFVLAPVLPPVLSSWIDVLPLIDTIFRILYLYGTVKLILDRNGPAWLRDTAMFFLVCYFLFCGVSLLGTLNVGTQQRHQLKIEWVLLIAGAPIIASMFSGAAHARWREQLSPRHGMAVAAKWPKRA